MKNSLGELIRIYERGHGRRLDAYLAKFENQLTLNEAIKVVHLYENQQVHPHQRRVGRSIFEDVVIPSLLVRVAEIEACQSFHDLHSCIKNLTSHVRRFGELAVYDTALRIGANRKLWPSVVYIHAGTKKGCKSLAIPANGETIELKELPEPLQSLMPHHAENFLCIFKDRFANGEIEPSGCLVPATPASRRC